jgi:hypothetical protein
MTLELIDFDQAILSPSEKLSTKIFRKFSYPLPRQSILQRIPPEPDRQTFYAQYRKFVWSQLQSSISSSLEQNDESLRCTIQSSPKPIVNEQDGIGQTSRC